MPWVPAGAREAAVVTVTPVLAPQYVNPPLSKSSAKMASGRAVSAPM